MRPKTLGDLALPTPMIERLQKMVVTDLIMNMLFYGKIGTGKTSAAHLFDSAAVEPPPLFRAVGWLRCEKRGFCQNENKAMPSDRGIRIDE